MNILLTGSNGFLGEYIKKELENFNLKTLNRTKSDFNFNLTNEIKPFSEKFELVIHCAGLAHTNINSEKHLIVNFEGTKNLINSLKQNPPRKFVFISSVSVYGLNSGVLINEKHPLNPNTKYSESKVKSEKILIEWCYKNDIKLTILRLPLLAGKNPPGNLGSMIKAISKGYFFIIGNGMNKKSIVLASDVAKIILKASSIGGIYNLTDGNNPTIKEITTCISNQLNKKVKYINLNLIKIIAFIGDLFKEIAPINSLKLEKLTSELTFDDNSAKNKIEWKPKSVVKNLII